MDRQQEVNGKMPYSRATGRQGQPDFMSGGTVEEQEIQEQAELQLTRQQAYDRGAIDRGMKVTLDECPYKTLSRKLLWETGWLDEAGRLREERHK